MKSKALKAAFPHTLPILVGFLFIGVSYGLLMQSSGFSLLWSLAMCVFVYAGSMQFAAVGLLLSPFDPLYALLLTLMVNARHIFYGISMLRRYDGCGAKKLYLIYGLCDETFSVNTAAEPPEGVDRGWFMFFVTLLDQLYWIAGAALGSVLGYAIRFNTRGIEFVMTALFVVLFIDQWLGSDDHFPALTGLVCAAVCLLIFGSGSFMLPAMALITAALLLKPEKTEVKA